MRAKLHRFVLCMLAVVMLIGMPLTAVSDEHDRPDDVPPDQPVSSEGAETEAEAQAEADPESHGTTGDFDDFVSIRNQTGTGQSRINLNTTDSIVINSDTWRLANDADTNQFEILEGGTTPRLVMRQGGNLGLGTSDPLSPLHINRSGGFQLRMVGSGADYRMDAFGTSLRIGDSTNTNQFRIFGAEAPFNALVVSDGIGIGTSTPEAPLHVTRNDGTGGLLVEETSATTAKRFLMRLENTGSPGFAIRNTASGEEWRYAMNANDGFVVSRAGTGGAEMLIAKNGAMFLGQPAVFRLSANGNLTIDGTLTENSDRSVKQDIEPVDVHAVLAQLRGLPVSTWAYRHTPGVPHMGPMAQDFHSLFGLGRDPTSISPRDMAGVALATIQALDEEVRAKDARIAELEADAEAKDARMDELEKRLERLERASAE